MRYSFTSLQKCYKLTEYIKLTISTKLVTREYAFDRLMEIYEVIIFTNVYRNINALDLILGGRFFF